MGGLFTRGYIILAATCLCALPALADDLLVMPYRCSIVGGRPLLTPAQNQGHRIIGAREQRSLRTCAPMNPMLCRQWTIHRFDMDCDGSPMPWATVVANLHPERAWLDNGRLHIRMPPSWTMAADDPCAAPPGQSERWRYGRLQRYCADRRALAPPAFVEMPAGFAPLLGIDAIFVTPSPKTVAQLPAPSVQPPVVPVAPISPSPARTEPSSSTRPPAQEAPPAKAPGSSNAEALAVAPAPMPVVPKIINRSEAVAETTAPAAGSSNAEVVAVAPSAAPVVPKIINRNDAGAATTAPPSLPAPPSESSVEKSSVLTMTTAAPTPAPSGLTFARGAVVVLACVLAAFAAIAVILVRARRHQPARGRTVAPTSVDRRRQRQAVPVRQQATEASAIWSTPTTSAGSTWNEEVPHTRSDALRVLGMGVTADANVAAMKKIVDGLRQTWHPDLARDPSDRELRERRMKQINVAWDILAAKPART